MLRIALFAIVALLFISLLSEEDTSDNESLENTTEVEESEFDKLTPEQKILVVRSYRSANMLFEQGQFPLVLVELRKIHQLISSYEDSKNMEKLSQVALETLRQKSELKREAERQKELIAKIKRIIDSCNKEFRKSVDVDGFQNCLEPALELDPENEVIQKLMEDINQRLAEQQRKKRSRNRYLARVNSGKKLYEEAKALQDQKKWLDAIDAYQKHIDSKYPDPGKFKDKSKQAMDKINNAIERKIASYQKWLMIKSKQRITNMLFYF